MKNLLKAMADRVVGVAATVVRSASSVSPMGDSVSGPEQWEHLAEVTSKALEESKKGRRKSEKQYVRTFNVGADRNGIKINIWLDSRPRKRPTLQRMDRLADYFGLDLRKRLKRMLGDYDAEVRRLHRARRYRAASWNAFLARAYFAWYVLRGPIDWIVGLVGRVVSGRG